MDLAISNWIFNTFGKSKFFAVLSKIVTYFGEWWGICLMVALLLCFKKTRKIGLYAGVACLLGYCFNNLFLKILVQRERPFVKHEEFKQMSALAGYMLPDGYSLASGHSVATMAFATSVLLQSKKAGMFAVPLMALVGISRVCLLVHFATDVLVGWCIGILFACVAFCLLNYLNELYLKKRGVNDEKNNLGNKK